MYKQGFRNNAAQAGGAGLVPLGRAARLLRAGRRLQDLQAREVSGGTGLTYLVLTG